MHFQQTFDFFAKYTGLSKLCIYYDSLPHFIASPIECQK